MSNLQEVTHRLIVYTLGSIYDNSGWATGSKRVGDIQIIDPVGKLGEAATVRLLQYIRGDMTTLTRSGSPPVLEHSVTITTEDA